MIIIIEKIKPGFEIKISDNDNNNYCNYKYKCIHTYIYLKKDISNGIPRRRKQRQGETITGMTIKTISAQTHIVDKY